MTMSPESFIDRAQEAYAQYRFEVEQAQRDSPDAEPYDWASDPDVADDTKSN